MAWVDALTHNRTFDRDRDVPRFRKAFRTLAGQRRTWPAPADFMEAFHATRPEVQLLTKQVIPADPQRAAAAMAEIGESLRMDRKSAAAGPDA